MRSSSGLPVPSKTVLRFLKLQSNLLYSSAISSSACSSRGGDILVSSKRDSRREYHTTPQLSSNYSQKDDPLSTQHEPFKALPAPRQSVQHHRNRQASTRTPRPQKNTAWRSLWSGFKRRSRWAAKDDCYNTGTGQDDTSAQLFNLSRALARSPAATDLKLRCTEFDANGSVTLVSGEFKKSELIAKYGLQPRDLRKIDSSILPHILVRPAAILINLLHLRVLIQSDRVLVFDAYGSTDSYTQSLFMYDLEGKLRQKADPRNSSTYLPYEFRALEAVLISVTSGLEAEFALVRDPVTHILAELEEDIDREKLRHLLIHSKKLGTFEQKARLVRDAIDDLLEADDDLAAMYLTERKNTGKPRAENDHQDIEMLLESYHKICDEIVEISGNLISNIRNTEEVVKAILDANRNQLMLLEIKFSIGTLGLAGGTLIAGLYGMNLNSFIEEADWGFGAVTGISFVLSGLICVYGMRKLRKVQKVRMWGDMESVATGRGDRHKEGRDSYARNLRLLHDTLRAQQQAQSQAQNQAQSQAYAQAGTASGPVLWPGMDGLGMHKLNQAISTGPSRTTAGGQVDEETGDGYSASTTLSSPTSQSEKRNNKILDPFEFKVHSDVDKAFERMKRSKEAEKGTSSKK